MLDSSDLYYWFQDILTFKKILNYNSFNKNRLKRKGKDMNLILNIFSSKKKLYQYLL